MLTKDTVGKANGVASLDSNGSVPIEQLGNIDTTLFLIVRELPTTDIKTNKIYLVPNQDGQGNNIYVEYLYVENVWEKLGEFKPEVDLSGYVTSDEIYQCIKKDYDSSKRGKGAIAIDDSAMAKGRNSIAIGASALTGSYDDNSIAIGASALTDYDYAIALGYNAHATRRYTISLGYNAQATSENTIVLGYNAQATNTNDIVLGYGAKSTGGNSIACGRNAQTKSRFSIVLGCDAKIIGDGYYNIALGCQSQSENYSAIAIGYYCRATGSNSIALGELAKAKGNNSTALGYRATATGNYTIALGFDSEATKDYTIALGRNKTSVVSKYTLGGFDDNKKVKFNLEEITYSQYGNKKYLIGLGGYDGTNITTNNEAVEEILNPNTKTVQEIIISKADLVDGELKSQQLPKLVNITNASTAEEVVTKFNALLADLKAKGYMEADTAQ